MDHDKQYPNFKDNLRYQCIDPDCLYVAWGGELLPLRNTGLWIGSEKRCPSCRGAVKEYVVNYPSPSINNNRQNIPNRLLLRTTSDTNLDTTTSSPNTLTNHHKETTMFDIRKGSHLIRYESLKFSGGEIQVKLLSPIEMSGDLIISAHLTSSDSIMELALLVDAINRIMGEYTPMSLICPYLPYARQDRVCAKGEALSVRVVANIINSLNFVSVEVWDVHSDVALAVLNNVKNIPQTRFVSKINWNNTILVAPDAGAIKKTMEAAKVMNLPMVKADKIRDVRDGSITGTVVHSDKVDDKNFLIIDDICDGGKTFTELAKVLRPLTTGNIWLYVTHGIFSKGLEVFDGLIDHIYTANPFPGVDTWSKKLTVL
jgi:ribose-phosphate pyrophosphokinase